MNEDEILKLVNILVGDIEPIGDTSEDEKSKEHLLLLIKIIKELHIQVSEIMWKTKDSPYASCKEICKICNDYFDFLGVKE